ncbi:MAG: DUF6498-containing protein [Pseudomonadota bacterium]
MLNLLTPNMRVRELLRAKELRSPTVVSTIVANLFPLLGVAFLQWDIFIVLLLYLFESVVIALFSIVKLVMVTKWRALYRIPGFLLVFALAMLVPVAAVGGLWDSERRVRMSSGELLTELSGGAILFAISHGLSFVLNYIGKREYRNLSDEEQFFAPFKRGISILIAAITGVFLILIREDPLGWFVALGFLSSPFLVGKLVAMIAEAHRTKIPIRTRLEEPVSKVWRRVEYQHLRYLFLVPAFLAVWFISPVAAIVVVIVIPKTILDVRAHLLERQIV